MMQSQRKTKKSYIATLITTSMLVFSGVLLSQNAIALNNNTKQVELDNGILAVTFYKEYVDNIEVIKSKLYRYINGEKTLIPKEDSSEGYYLFDLKGLAVSQDRFYSYWHDKEKPINEENKIWSPFNIPNTKKLVPKDIIKKGAKVILMFSELEQGALTVTWGLPHGQNHFDIAMNFKPKNKHHYALGYKIFIQKELEQINELLLPMMWQQKRFPEKPYTLYDAQLPTPVSMVDFGKGANRYSYSLVCSPEIFDFEWTSQLKRKIGMLIRNEEGLVQPAICGPFDGVAEQKEELNLNFKILVDQSDWNKSFRRISDEIYQLKDYRKNYNTNLTDAILNMIDLIKDDDKSGWWDRAKGFYQIESRNAATQAVPLVLLSLYHLTGDMELYNKRVLPTMEFVLSRSGYHFSPEPNEAGGYPKADMAGPIKDFGTTFYGGAWQMTNHYMPVFKDIAFADNGIIRTANKAHIQEFNEWLAKYEITNEKETLNKACQLADAYIRDYIEKPAKGDLGLAPFFLMSFVPDWEGLLRLYEVTGKQKYLEASKKGANWLTTGIWAQPIAPEGEVTIHKNNIYEGDIPGAIFSKGNKGFRLGYELDRNSPNYRTQINPPKEKKVPSWLVSNVGLGFEQAEWIFSPSDQKRKRTRLIYQAPWTPDFLRISLYTQDKMYEKYARNAVVGRWSNYPGYYATGFTDLPNQPNYPFVGPDISFIYYHHIPVHLGWSIDYLLSDTYLLSKEKVDFPFQRQNGYAYFDMRVYGYKPGKAFGNENLWLWFKKDLLSISNEQINYITAHSKKELFIILTNQSKDPQNFTLTLKDIKDKKVTLYQNDTKEDERLEGNNIELELPPRGILMLQVKNTGIEFPENHYAPKEPKSKNEEDKLNTNSFEIAENIVLKGASIQISPDFWSGYTWIEAKYGEIKKVTFHYSFDGTVYKQIQDDEYPFECSSKMRNNLNTFYYYAEVVTKEEKVYKTKPQIVKRVQ